MSIRMKLALAALCPCLLAAAACQAQPQEPGAGQAPPLVVPVGGENSPAPSPPVPLAIETAEWNVGSFSLKIPTGRYTAPEGGAANYTVPGPVVSIKGPDGQWRGHGYLETYPRLLEFTGKREGKTALLEYRFEQDKSYTVKLTADDGVVLIEETSNLGPRNVYVFDAYYNWQPAAGFVTNLPGRTASFVYLPCYYDKPEATLNPATDRKKTDEDEKCLSDEQIPGAVAVTAANPESKDVVGFFCRDVDSWDNGSSMGIQLWQRRQRPSQPASRHFLGPETKSDSTPNPRTAGMLGQSQYEGHVTIELNLGQGSRKLGLVVCPKGQPKAQLAKPFQSAVQANQ
ncbi:MAG: hypothetical protein ACLFUJ_07375 [Phycisphaerae bacterium]